MKRKLLGGALAMAACCAMFGAVSSRQSSVVMAQSCKETQPGKQLATGDGTLVCDCTGGGTTCGCVVAKDCPKTEEAAMAEY